MTKLIIVFVIGVFVGMFIGVLLTALMAVNGRSSEEIDMVDKTPQKSENKEE